MFNISVSLMLEKTLKFSRIFFYAFILYLLTLCLPLIYLMENGYAIKRKILSVINRF